MTATYDLSTNNGKLRLSIGDTDTSDTVFTDEELAIFLDGASLNMAAAAAMEAWASKYAANANSEKIGDYSYSQKTVDDMLKLAQRFRDKDASIPVSDYGEMDLTDIGLAL